MDLCFLPEGQRRELIKVALAAKKQGCFDQPPTARLMDSVGQIGFGWAVDLPHVLDEVSASGQIWRVAGITASAWLQVQGRPLAPSELGALRHRLR